MTTYYYRAMASHQIRAMLSIFGEDSRKYATIYFVKYPVVKRTACGAWVWDGRADRRRFILDLATKKFAHPTKDEALRGYKARTKRYIAILRAKLEDAQAGYEAAREGRMSSEGDYSFGDYREACE